MPKQALAVVVRRTANGSSVENLYDMLIAGTLFCIGHDPRSFPSISVNIFLGLAIRFSDANKASVTAQPRRLSSCRDLHARECGNAERRTRCSQRSDSAS